MLNKKTIVLYNRQGPLCMKGLILLLLLVLLTGCAQSGYTPSYIISDVDKEGYTVEE